MINPSRRQFLRTLGTSAATLAVAGGCTAQSDHRSEVRAGAVTSGGGRDTRGAARNLIFLISDGMSLGTLSLADQFRRRRDGRNSVWLDFYRQAGVRRALMDTASASSLVTDSAAAASAWGGGLRVNNGALNVGPAGERPAPLFAVARESGRAAGLVSTATITHATPAGFAINIGARGDEGAIAELYADTALDLFLGGGARFFDARQRTDRRDLFGLFRQKGFHVVRNQAALRQAPASGRLLGIFADGHLPYALDRASTPALTANVPTLAALTDTAIQRLSGAGGGRGFVLQVEGARIDHAAHANDFAGLVHDQLAFEDALAVALRFAESRDDTLVIVTTDHGNANPGLNGTGTGYKDTDRLFERSFTFRHTNDWILSGLKPESPATALQERIQAATGLSLTTAELDLVLRATRQDYTDAYRARASPMVILGQVLGNHIAVGWSGISHTSDLVEVSAWGPGSEAVTGLMQNTDVHGLVHRALDLPQVS